MYKVQKELSQHPNFVSQTDAVGKFCSDVAVARPQD